MSIVDFLLQAAVIIEVVSRPEAGEIGFVLHNSWIVISGSWVVVFTPFSPDSPRLSPVFPRNPPDFHQEDLRLCGLRSQKSGL